MCDKVTNETVVNATSLRRQSNYVYIGAADYSDQTVLLCKKSSFPLDVWTIDSEAQIISLPTYVSGVTSNCLHAGRILHKIYDKD